MGKIFCFFSPHAGFSGGSCFAVCPPVSWSRELSASSESLLELPRTAEVFSGSAGRLPCLSGEGQTSFWVPRSGPAKSSDVLGFLPPLCKLYRGHGRFGLFLREIQETVVFSDAISLALRARMFQRAEEWGWAVRKS